MASTWRASVQNVRLNSACTLTPSDKASKRLASRAASTDWASSPSSMASCNTSHKYPRSNASLFWYSRRSLGLVSAWAQYTAHTRFSLARCASRGNNSAAISWAAFNPRRLAEMSARRASVPPIMNPRAPSTMSSFDSK